MDITAAEVIQAMRLADLGKVSEQLNRMEKDNPDFLMKLRDLFTLCKRDKPQ